MLRNMLAARVLLIVNTVRIGREYTTVHFPRSRLRVGPVFSSFVSSGVMWRTLD